VGLTTKAWYLRWVGVKSLSMRVGLLVYVYVYVYVVPVHVGVGVGVGVDVCGCGCGCACGWLWVWMSLIQTLRPARAVWCPSFSYKQWKGNAVNAHLALSFLTGQP
jgi:hypothetical protein